MPTIRLTIEYHGKGFHGWQFQPNLRTVQGELEKVIETVMRQKMTSRLRASSRTDAGVHARGQVAVFSVDTLPNFEILRAGVNGILRREVAILDVCEVADDFNPRDDAIAKQYTYRILYRRAPPTLDFGQVWHLSGSLDLDRLRSGLQEIIGEHDFSSFRAADCAANSPVREILSAELIETPPYLNIRIIGRSFLKQMVRSIVGTLVGMARHDHRYPNMSFVLDAKKRIGLRIVKRSCEIFRPGKFLFERCSQVVSSRDWRHLQLHLGPQAA
jgi:tRNA pseudouridine38-40 synthase